MGSNSLVGNFRGKLKSAAGKTPGGVTTLAKTVGCSALTARKHLARMVESGELRIVQGTRGALYTTKGGKVVSATATRKEKHAPGAPSAKVAKVSKGKALKKGQEVFVHTGGRKFVAHVTLVSTAKGRVKVENSEGRSWVGVRSSKSPSGWMVRGTVSDYIETV